VLLTAVELGVNHIDTADADGPYTTNEIIREALVPYSEHVHIVTKVGVVRDDRGGWLPANSPQSLREQVHDNLRRLGLDLLDVVNLRTLAGIDERATGFGHARAAVRGAGRATAAWPDPAPGPEHGRLDQLAEAQRIAPVVCVQNFYNIANRADEAVLAATAEQQVAYVPHFPLGGFSPLQSDVLELVAKRLDATPTAVAQSWLQQHSPNMMLIPGTSSVAHLRENIAGAALTLRPDGVAVRTRSGQWTPTIRCRSGPVCSSPPTAGRERQPSGRRCAQPPQTVIASRFCRPVGGAACQSRQATSAPGSGRGPRSPLFGPDSALGGAAGDTTTVADQRPAPARWAAADRHLLANSSLEIEVRHPWCIPSRVGSSRVVSFVFDGLRPAGCGC
jgi:pyridoxine 4-dehydrogenase